MSAGWSDAGWVVRLTAVIYSLAILLLGYAIGEHTTASPPTRTATEGLTQNQNILWKQSPPALAYYDEPTKTLHITDQGKAHGVHCEPEPTTCTFGTGVITP